MEIQEDILLERNKLIYKETLNIICIYLNRRINQLETDWPYAHVNESKFYEGAIGECKMLLADLIVAYVEAG